MTADGAEGAAAGTPPHASTEAAPDAAAAEARFHARLTAFEGKPAATGGGPRTRSTSR